MNERPAFDFKVVAEASVQVLLGLRGFPWRARGQREKSCEGMC